MKTNTSMFRTAVSILSLLAFSSGVFAQNINKKAIESRLRLSPKETLPETILQIGETFLGLPYVASTLESSPEQLVCKLDAFDCYTFVENVLAISLTKESEENNFEEYLNNLQNLRYRGGKIDGYASRIHYFFEWARQAEASGFIEDLSPELGVKINKQINFMSTHRQFYPAFATDNTVWGDIKKMEKALAGQEFFEIPKAKFASVEKQIKNGDIIAFTSTVAGLDVNHEGFAVWRNGKLHLMHASLEQKKVIISAETLGEYLQRIKKHSGIMVLRPI